MEVLLQVGVVTVSVCAAAVLLRRIGRRTDSPIRVGDVSATWLAEYRVRGRDWTGVE